MKPTAFYVCILQKCWVPRVLLLLLLLMWQSWREALWAGIIWAGYWNEYCVFCRVCLETEHLGVTEHSQTSALFLLGQPYPEALLIDTLSVDFRRTQVKPLFPLAVAITGKPCICSSCVCINCVAMEVNGSTFSLLSSCTVFFSAAVPTCIESKSLGCTGERGLWFFTLCSNFIVRYETNCGTFRSFEGGYEIMSFP